MVLRIPETGLQLESSAKTADTLPMQAFAITLSDSVIEDLIQCAQNGEDIRLSLGNVPSFLYGKDMEVHKISKATEIPDLDLYLTDPSESTQHAERFPHPTMSLFAKPPLSRFPRLAAGREVVREKPSSKTSAAGRKTQADLPDDVERLKQSMEKAKSDKKENSTKILDPTFAKRNVKGGSSAGSVPNGSKKLLSGKTTGAVTGTIGPSTPASPALSGIVSPSIGPTLSAAEQAKEEARELRAPIVHELAVREMSFKELQSKWRGDSEDFQKALEKVADFDKSLQKYAMKKMYWKELDVFKYDYDSDEKRQNAIDNAIRMYDRMRMSASEPVWDRLLPKEERGKGKCLSKLLPTIAKGPSQPAAKTPQIKVHDADDSSGSRNGDAASNSGSEGKKGSSQAMSRSSSQTKAPVKKVEKKLIGKKISTPKPLPAKASAKSAKDKGGRVLSKEFISDSDSSSEEAPLSKKKEEKDRERERERQREREREREQEREREREKEKEREKERERERERERREKSKEREIAAMKPKSKAPTKDAMKSQVAVRPVGQKRSRDEEDDSSSSSGTPLSKRINRESKSTAPVHHNAISYKRPPSDSSSQGSSRSNTYAATQGYPTKNKNTSPVKSSPLASSPPTNASDFDQPQQSHHDDSRHERERDRSRDRSVTVANSTNINNASTKKRKMKAEASEAVYDVATADKKRARVSEDVIDEARRFKQFYEIYQRLHYELSEAGNFSQEKYEKLLNQRKRLEGLKRSIYAQIPRECY